MKTAALTFPEPPSFIDLKETFYDEIQVSFLILAFTMNKL